MSLSWDLSCNTVYNLTFLEYPTHHTDLIFLTMTPIATEKQEPKNKQSFNPFYSPSITDDGNDQYKYAQYKVRAIPIPSHWLT
jgi:hypothetical protein